jgi:hypothetical protein
VPQEIEILKVKDHTDAYLSYLLCNSTLCTGAQLSCVLKDHLIPVNLQSHEILELRKEVVHDQRGGKGHPKLSHAQNKLFL